jgi:iron complex transport system ATP-binding protein
MYASIRVFPLARLEAKMIEVVDLKFGYTAGRPLLKGVTLAIRPGEMVSILGPNGCGKTTLLKIVLGFLPAPIDSVRLNGQDVRSYSRRDLARQLAYVPQTHTGIFNYSVREMVLMGRTAASPWLRFSAEDRRKAEQALERVRIAHLADRPYLHLSGGERQMVLIARALAQNSAFLIMDEPVSGLDYGNQYHLLKVIRELADSEGLGIILTTHHPEQSLLQGGRALMLKDGLLKADGPVDEVVTGRSICDLYGLPPEFLNRPALS